MFSTNEETVIYFLLVASAAVSLLVVAIQLKVISSLKASVRAQTRYRQSTLATAHENAERRARNLESSITEHAIRADKFEAQYDALVAYIDKLTSKHGSVVSAIEASNKEARVTLYFQEATTDVLNKNFSENNIVHIKLSLNLDIAFQSLLLLGVDSIASHCAFSAKDTFLIQITNKLKEVVQYEAARVGEQS